MALLVWHVCPPWLRAIARAQSCKSSIGEVIATNLSAILMCFVSSHSMHVECSCLSSIGEGDCH